VQGLVYEREGRYFDTQAEIGNTWGAPQTILGPILVMEQGDTTTYILPEQLEIESTVNPELRSRGIFNTVVYQEKIVVKGIFSTDNIDTQLRQLTPKFIVSLTDTRSIEEMVTLSWNDTEIPFEPGTTNNTVGESGLHASVPLSYNKEQYDFAFELNLKGSEQVSFVPVGQETVVRLSSSWNSPSFNGAYLPNERTISESGFDAVWKVSAFGRSYPQVWTEEGTVTDKYMVRGNLLSSQFGVELDEGVDIYTQVFRSIKYAILFILITFTAFFLFETLLKIRVHPIQYLLIGVSLALFYLLLLSMTEHIGFLLAYLIASTMVIVLITTYSISVLKQKSRAFYVFSILTALYSYMYFVLKLEDYALLFGSFLVFVLIATVMYLTRNINWYLDSETT